MNNWIPYKSDIVTKKEIVLWNLCVKQNMSWDDINNIERLLFIDGANPFIRDVCGNYLSTVVFLGFWWTTYCQLEHLTSFSKIKSELDDIINIDIRGEECKCRGQKSKQKIIVKYAESEYQTHVYNLLKKRMYEVACEFEKKTQIHDLYWAQILPRFVNVARQFLLINGSLAKQTMKFVTNICTYGFFPRDIAYILLRHISMNIVFDILNNTKDSLNTFTIENIYDIGKNMSHAKGTYSNNVSTKLIDLKKKRPRKNILVNEIDSICLNVKKQKDEFGHECSKLPNVVGCVIATCNELTLTCDIQNPMIKPFIMIGRKYDKNRPNCVNLDNTDLDVTSFPHSSRVSRNNMKIRYNPITSQLEVLLIARNGLIIKRNNIDIPIIDKSWWIPLMPGDIVVQNATNIQYTFVIYA